MGRDWSAPSASFTGRNQSALVITFTLDSRNNSTPSFTSTKRAPSNRWSERAFGTRANCPKRILSKCNHERSADSCRPRDARRQSDTCRSKEGAGSFRTWQWKQQAQSAESICRAYAQRSWTRHLAVRFADAGRRIGGSLHTRAPLQHRFISGATRSRDEMGEAARADEGFSHWLFWLEHRWRCGSGCGGGIAE